MQNELEKYIDEALAAELLGLSVRTMQKFRVEGGGPEFCKFGKSVRYARRELITWATARQRSSTSHISV